MPKNIVLLSDGTGNSAAKLFKTNVWRTYQALDLQSGDQIAIYDDGVGTDSFKPLALLGGAIGLGLRRNVLDLYTFLCRNHRPGDRIYCFGFSRGAFTIRTLVGLIASQGVVQAAGEADLHEHVHEAYARDREEFRTNLGRARDRLGLRVRRPPRPPLGRPVDSITFLGLWDTVDAYGMPIEELKRGIDLYIRPLTFPDRTLWPGVERACHALALDDERRTFHPVLWDEQGSVNPQRIKQVWFAGVHSNVGGGYPNDALAHVPLAWIMTEADQVGLRFKPGALQEVQALADPHGEQHDSRAGLAAYYRYAPRKLAELGNDAYHDVHVDRPKVHESVLLRIKEGRVPYAPTGIPADYDVVRLNGTIEPLRRLTTPTGAPLYESVPAAAARAGTPGRVGEQERAWDRVWWRRLLYLLTLAASAFLAGFPWWFPPVPGGACSGRWCFIDPLLGFLGGFAPGWLAPWIEAFRLAPVAFIPGALVLAASLTASAWTARRIADATETAWRHLKPKPLPPSTPYTPRVVYRLRTSRGLLGTYRVLTRTVAPFLFALALLAGGVAGVSRGLFEVVSSFGWACPGSPAPRVVGAEAVTVDFGTAEPCQATGYALERGKRYAITLQATAPWSDNDIPVPDVLRGFTSAEASAKHWRSAAIMYAASPLKRSLGRNWFQPIARIGTYGKDQYSLGERPIRARTDGELFLFVNDAVLGVPNVWPVSTVWSRFYPNNRGRATVTIRRIDPVSR